LGWGTPSQIEIVKEETQQTKMDACPLKDEKRKEMETVKREERACWDSFPKK
jgi:hypothetical protein